MAVISLVFVHFSKDLPDYTELANYDPDTVTRLYANDGRLLAEYATEKRVYVPLKYVPKLVSEAFIAAEDKNFYSNNGIDIYGIARAVRQNLQHILGNGHTVSGGSTITQQLVKNFLLTPEKSLTRKIKEAILAYRITQVYSKDRILELYLNEIYLGKGSYGIAAAALNYFNKSLDELTIEEAGFLAAMPQAPARIDPVVHYDRAKERRDYVINRLMEDNYITPAQARTAIATPIVLQKRDSAETTSADFFAEEVRRDLANRYGGDAVYKGGLFVKTTLDPQMQRYSDDALRFALTEYDHRHGFRGAVAHFDTYNDWQKRLAAVEAEGKIPLFNGERLALVAEVTKKATTVYFANNTKGYLEKDSLKWVQQTKGLKVGDVLIVAPRVEKDYYAVHQIPLVNGAMIVMDPHTGKVLAMSGGYSSAGTEFNRATQAKRQPGSAFKPFVYLSAMENGFTPASIVIDQAVELSQGSGMPIWRPNNYHGDFLGPATLRTGIEKSRNAMTIRLSQMLGIDAVIEIAERFGLYDKLPRQFSMVLGAQETTLMKLANGYCQLVNGGKKVEPWLIERIDDRNGKTILRRDTRNCKDCQINENTASDEPPVIEDNRKQIVDNRAAYQVVSMLQGVVEHGTGFAAHKIGKILAGKTGTTNDSRDTWFVGFSPDLVAGIYVGYDQPKTLGAKETGASVALPGFIHFMEQALKDVPSRPFDVPPGIEFIQVNNRTGLPPLPGETGRIVNEAFKTGEYPGQRSEVVMQQPETVVNPPPVTPASAGSVNPAPIPFGEPSVPLSPEVTRPQAEKGLGGLY